MSDYGFGAPGLNRRMARQDRVWQWRQAAHGLSAAELRERVRVANERLAQGYGPIGEQTEMVEAFAAELQARRTAAGVA